jgi:AraC-like DNA-binding protein
MSLINNHYFITLFNVAAEMGVCLDKLARDTGVKRDSLEDNSLWVDDESLAMLINTLWRETDDECMGLTATPIAMGTSAFIFEYMLGADTLGELYRRGQKACAMLPGAEGINYRVENGTATIEIRNGYVGARDPKRFLIEFIVVIWHRFACWATDHYISLKAASFCYPEPDHLFCYNGLFECPVSFDQKATGFSFDNKNLSKPIVRSKKELADWLRHSPSDLLSMPGRDTTISNQIRGLLTKQLRTSSVLPSFAVICQKMNITTHKAQRRLSEEGSSYQRVKDAVRLELLKEMLENPDYSIADVSESVGFTEVTSFTRAVKKWTGMTPAQYRKSII